MAPSYIYRLNRLIVFSESIDEIDSENINPNDILLGSHIQDQVIKFNRTLKQFKDSLNAIKDEDFEGIEKLEDQVFSLSILQSGIMGFL